MTSQRALHVSDDGRIDGLKVIAFQGAVDPASTPAQRAPLVVDEQFRLSRVLDLSNGPDGTQAVVESIEPPLPAEGPLPGVATRLPSFPAMVDGVVAIVGQSERRILHRIDIDKDGIPPRVVGFLRWLRDDPGLAADVPWGRSADGLWACYLTMDDRQALWRLLHPEVYRSLRDAVRADDPPRMVDGAFWLSRVVAYPQSDFFKAALALRRAGSPHWQMMLREGLRLTDEAAWEKGLEEAAYAFADHREASTASPHRYRAREEVRRGAANR